MRYQTFSIHLYAIAAETYRVRATSPAGQAEAPLELPFPVAATRAWEESGEGSFTDESLGQGLFAALFTGAAGEIGRLFERSLGALNPGEGLRLLVQANPHDAETTDLAQLPWELLHDRAAGRFLALDRRTPVVRSLDVPHRKTGFQDEPPLRVLAALSDPTCRIDLDTAATELEALSGVDSLGAERLRVDVLRGAERRVLRRRLREAEEAGTPYHVLHMVAHGLLDGEEGQVVLEKGGISGPELVHLLQDLSDLRLVYLGVCDGARTPVQARHVFGGLAQALLRGGVTAVVAMQHAIADGAARQVSTTFYRGLSQGEPIEAALAEARLTLDGQGGRESHWSTPVLFTRLEDPAAAVGDAPGKVTVTFWGSPRRRWGAVAATVLLVVLLGITGSQVGRRAEAADLRDEAMSLLTQGRPAEAAEMLVLSLAAFAGDAAAHANLGAVLEEMGQYPRAESHLRRAAELAPEAAIHAYNLGRFLGYTLVQGKSREERLEEALDALTRAVRLKPGFAAAANERARVLFELGRLTEADRAVRSALQLVQGTPEAAPLERRRAWIALAEGRYDEVREAMTAARVADGGRDPWGDQEAVFAIARAEFEAGRPAAVCQGLAELWQLDPLGISPWRGEAESLAEESECT
jgi:tetratricopeptide (TPR) repeat protein